MKHKTRKLFSIFLALVMVLGLAPAMSQTAQAAENDGVKAISLGTAALEGSTPNVGPNEGEKHYTPNSYVWFGVNGDDTKPIQWRVLDAEKANDGTTAGMFLLSEYLLASDMYFDEWYFEEYIHQHDDGKWYKGANHTDECTNVKANVYQGSDAQGWCRDFAANESIFTRSEQAAMLGVDKTDSAEDSLYGNSWSKSGLTTADKVFFLSARELADYVGNYNYAPGLKASFDGGGNAHRWWLRSPDDYSTDKAGVVSNSGDVDDNDVDRVRAARPAFNLDLSKVLFTSAAENGKEAGANGLAEIGDNTTNEWKLTLEDTANRSAFYADVTAVDGEKLTVAWCGAEAGENEFLSAVIKDNASGALTHYGRLAELKDESDKYGTREIDLSGINMTDKTLYVFNEQYNGEKKTDYASKLVELPTDTPNAYPVELSVRGFTVINYWNSVRPNDLTIRMYLKLNPGYYYMGPDYNTLQVEIGDKVYGKEALYQAAGTPDLFFVDVYDPANGGFSGKVKITYTTEPIHYDIKYELDGGTNNENNPKTYTVEDTITLADPEWRGHTFDGWYETADFSGSPVTEIPANSTENKTFWAKWTPMTYTITFDPNGGNVTPTSGTTGADGKLTSLPTPTRSGSYRFDGWYTEKTGGTKVDENTVFSANDTIYAHWAYTGGGSGGGSATTKYTLTYNTNGGNSIIATKHDKNATVNLTATPIREGYDFTGWYADKELKNAVTSVKMDGDKTVYAGWKAAGAEVDTPAEETPLLVVTINSMTYRLNGKTMMMDSAPFIDGNNRTMLPVRVIANALGISNDNIKWDSATKTASFTRADGKVVSCTVNSNVIKVGDEKVTIDTVPVIRNGRIYLPMRALFNAFDVPDENIIWDAAARTVTVTKKD